VAPNRRGRPNSARDPVDLIEIACFQCGGLFHVCIRDYRGQGYYGRQCRELGSLLTLLLRSRPRAPRGPAALRGRASPFGVPSASLPSRHEYVNRLAPVLCAHTDTRLTGHLSALRRNSAQR
jgi:hypothetical protein